MIDRKRITTVAAAVLLSSALASSVFAAFITFDPTGTWTGSIKCKSFFAGTKEKFTLTPTMKISQNGLRLDLVLDYGGGDTETYTGLANPDAKKPTQKGQLALTACGTDDLLGNAPTFDELGTMSVATKPPPSVKASFKGTSIFSVGLTFPKTEAGTCKWKWTRKDLIDPGVVTACGLTALTLPPTAP